MLTHFSILGIFYFWPSWSQLPGVVKSESIKMKKVRVICRKAKDAGKEGEHIKCKESKSVSLQTEIRWKIAGKLLHFQQKHLLGSILRERTGNLS